MSCVLTSVLRSPQHPQSAGIVWDPAASGQEGEPPPPPSEAAQSRCPQASHTQSSAQQMYTLCHIKHKQPVSQVLTCPEDTLRSPNPAPSTHGHHKAHSSCSWSPGCSTEGPLHTGGAKLAHEPSAPETKPGREAATDLSSTCLMMADETKKPFLPAHLEERSLGSRPGRCALRSTNRTNSSMAKGRRYP